MPRGCAWCTVKLQQLISTADRLQHIDAAASSLFGYEETPLLGGLVALLGIAGATGTSSVMRILGTDLSHYPLCVSTTKAHEHDRWVPASAAAAVVAAQGQLQPISWHIMAIAKYGISACQHRAQHLFKLENSRQ